MQITCQNCEKTIEEYLCQIPFQWRSQIAKAICANLSEQTLDCQKVKDCETVTKLSGFTVNGTEVCITYMDEDKVEFTRCFDMGDLDCPLDGTDPKCITTQEIWDAMTCKEKIQAIIDYGCDCVPITTSTTTTTTVP